MMIKQKKKKSKRENILKKKTVAFGSHPVGTIGELANAGAQPVRLITIKETR